MWNMKKICVRVDADSRIGMGHFMRCNTVLEECRRREMECHLITMTQEAVNLASEETWLTKHLLKGNAFDADDAKQTVSIMKSVSAGILLMDSYYLTQAYIDEIKSAGMTIACFQDYDQSLKQIDCIFSPNAPFWTNHSESRQDSNVFSGLTYQPIRRSFFRDTPVISKKLRKILLLTGGVFPENLVQDLIRSLLAHPGDFELSVVISPLTQLDDRRKVINSDRLSLINGVTELWKLFFEQDLIISAAGSTVYEIAASRVPAVVFSMAENQRFAIQKLATHLGFCYCGDIEDDSLCTKIISGVDSLESKAARMHQIEQMKAAVLEDGAKHIVDRILEVQR